MKFYKWLLDKIALIKIWKSTHGIASKIIGWILIVLISLIIGIIIISFVLFKTKNLDNINKINDNKVETAKNKIAKEAKEAHDKETKRLNDMSATDVVSELSNSCAIRDGIGDAVKNGSDSFLDRSQSVVSGLGRKGRARPDNTDSK
ncbi:MAG: hypothetical protein M0P71_18240 [Melioribacteraceae bacterium]|jgi:hypothetical protein|nr:hypothetical protein [Melioribacteraceae bacterium]